MSVSIPFIAPIDSVTAFLLRVISTLFQSSCLVSFDLIELSVDAAFKSSESQWEKEEGVR